MSVNLAPLRGVCVVPDLVLYPDLAASTCNEPRLELERNSSTDRSKLDFRTGLSAEHVGCLARGGAFQWPGSQVPSLPVPGAQSTGDEAGAAEASKAGKGGRKKEEGAAPRSEGSRRGANKGKGKGQLQEIQPQSAGQTVTAWKSQLLKDVGDGKQLLLRLSDTPYCGECGS